MKNLKWLGEKVDDNCLFGGVYVKETVLLVLEKFHDSFRRLV